MCVTSRSHSLHLHNSSCQSATAEGDIFSISLGKQGLSIKCVKWSGMSVRERRASFVPMWGCCGHIDSLLFMRPALSPTNQCLLGVFSPACLERKMKNAEPRGLLFWWQTVRESKEGWEDWGCVCVCVWKTRMYKGKREVWERKAGVEREAGGGQGGSLGSFEHALPELGAPGVLVGVTAVEIHGHWFCN